MKLNQEEFGLIKATGTIQAASSQRDSLRVEIQMEDLGTVVCIWHKCKRDHVYVDKEVDGAMVM